MNEFARREKTRLHAADNGYTSAISLNAAIRVQASMMEHLNHYAIIMQLEVILCAHMHYVPYYSHIILKFPMRPIILKIMTA